MTSWEWCGAITRIPTGRPEPCSLIKGHPESHWFTGPGDCTGKHDPWIVCARCDDGFSPSKKVGPEELRAYIAQRESGVAE